MEQCKYIRAGNNGRPRSGGISVSKDGRIKGNNRDPRKIKRVSNTEQGSSPGRVNEPNKGISKSRRKDRPVAAKVRMPLDFLNNPKPTIIEKPNIVRWQQTVECRRPEPRIIRLHEDDKGSGNSQLPENDAKTMPKVEVPINPRMKMLIDHLDNRFPGFYIRTHSIHDNDIIPIFPFFDG